MGELRNIPGVGKKTEEDLQMLGYTTIDVHEPEKLKWWNWED